MPEAPNALDTDRFAGRIARVLRGHIWMIVLVGVYVAPAVILAPWFNKIILAPSNAWRTLSITLLFVAGFLVLYPLRVFIFIRPERPLSYLRQQMRDKYFTVERILSAFLSLSLITVFASGFSFFKSIIPVVQPFSWDKTLADADRVAHLGYHPWQLLQPLIGYPALTMWMDRLYLSWFFVMTGMLVGHAFSLSRPLLRMQFFTTYLLSWILLGNLLAIILSSAGPCYYGMFVHSDDPYVVLMDYLRTVDHAHGIHALNIQNWLWEGYVSGESSLGYGISAMPSMHVGVTFLLGLVGWHTSRTCGVCLWLYCVVILVGSVQLGWHYAIDGYVAILGTWLLWCIVGRMLRRDAFLSQATSFAEEPAE